MSLQDNQALRSEFMAEIRARLIGPLAPDEALPERPNKRYLTGMVFPKGTTTSAATADEEEQADDISADDDQDELESPVDMLFQRLPASVGMTFALAHDGKRITVLADGAKYERRRAEVVAADADEAPARAARGVPLVWQRVSLGERENGAAIEFDLADGDRQEKPILGGHANVQLFVRRAQGVRVATVSLINASTLEEEAPLDVSEILFQVRLKCVPDCGIPAYPDPPVVSDDPEAEELALQYRSLPAFAVGHGCGVAWPEPEAGVVASVEVDYLPAVEVPPVTTEIDDLPPPVVQALSLYRLQDQAHDPLPAFVQLLKIYRAWRGRLDSEDVPPRFATAKRNVLARIDAVIGRMADGISLLQSTPEVMTLFRMANRAMLLSLARAQANRERKPGERFRDVDIAALDPDAICWRPFQIAFFLLSLRGLWEPGHADRRIADLIWFPTGGGKTEAYLAVAAFEMLRRRVVDGARGGGTAVVKRYTLRLLTIQQFERAGGLMCALETMRQHGEIRTAEPFSLGLWVGGDSSPNDHAGACSDLQKIFKAAGRVEGVKVPLKHCPVCATPIVRSPKNEGTDGVGLREVAGKVEVFCPNADCCYHGALPISFIDDHLYATPPTMLLGTVDKFAMLAWRHEARAFFGTDRDVDPPSLIIQDELHLISGPLGTIAGIYEAAIDTAIAQLGRPAKYICATATIRRADEQIRKLYGRQACLFPPPGLDATDSFFSRARHDAPGRLYVGAMGQGHTPTFSNVIASAALLAAGGEMCERVGERADTWWTLVAYHNSKRELGKTLSLARDDIPARLKALGEDRNVRGSGVQELSANLPDGEIPEVLHKLGVNMTSPQALDFVACTNMLSVGVDVPRLGLMMVNGQPKTVSEYIQASSRVGRDNKRPPGVVMALFSPTKPRDRSHYEFFRPFHKGYYRHVEPTSVTPYALPAQNRGLHGAFLALVRMVSSLHANEACHQIVRKEVEIRQLADAFLHRIAEARDGDLNETTACLQGFLAEWLQAAAERGANLRFQSGGKQHGALIRPFRKPGEGRETLQSLRHVDTPLKLLVRRNQTNPAGGTA
ncbi:helicase-related protein [Burkholderia vietnamiensis]|uniref:helicase-related protein n=1 Tax=Burkholderia vietnamiensis TaxID=60552 RepID=UPI000753937D|nr:helicase-related protein [Burkholderia vietnamiensis]KVR98556.1 hypothetical protein WK28_05710 [Burkholderia vietnamiensis]